MTYIIAISIVLACYCFLLCHFNFYEKLQCLNLSSIKVFNVLPCQNAQQVIQKLYEEKWNFNASFYLELA